MNMVMKYCIQSGSKMTKPFFDVGINRHDGLLVACFIFRLGLSCREGAITIKLPKILLNSGNYFVSILVYKELDLHGKSLRFYTIDENLIDAHVRCYEFKVEGSHGIDTAVLSHPFDVSVEGDVPAEIFNKVM